jgi:hypothetical protein
MSVDTEALKDGQRHTEQKVGGLAPPPSALRGGTPGSVSLSRKMGWSTHMGREKADVMVTVTLPSGTSDEDLDATILRLRGILDRTIERELDHVVDKYFDGGPVTFGSGRTRT